jgi:putative transposase
MSEAYQSLTHSRWNCKYYVVFVPKRRRKALFGHIRQALGPIFHELARQKEQWSAKKLESGILTYERVS